MRHIAKHIAYWAVIIGGSLITYSCGQDNSPSSNYKAGNTIGSDNPTTVTNTVSSPSEMGVGDVYSVIFDGENPGRIDFDGTESSAQFIMTVSALDTVQTSRSVQLSDESTSPEEIEELIGEINAGWSDMSVNEALDQQLRGAEMALSLDPSLRKASGIANASSAMKAMLTAKGAALPRIGDVETFRVLAGLSSLSSYKSVDAVVKCVGDKVIFYVDSQVAANNPSDLTDSDVLQLCSDFDRTAAAEIELFGEPSDVNNDSRVAVLMTPQVNRLGAMGGGIITGFFFANDLYSSSNSNQREVIYVMVPDSGGKYGVTIPKSFAMTNLLPAVLPHELQHAINYNQKVFVAGGSAEENWLNEGLSHLSEDLLGYGQENPSRVDIFLTNPSYYGPVSAGSPNLAERGAVYLLLRYLYEQADDKSAFVWNLLHSDITGVANLEAAFGGRSEDFDQISEFLLRWSTALVMSSFNLSTDPRFSYAARGFNDTTNHYEGICLSCDAEDGRGTILSGVAVSTYYGVSLANIEATASQFYQIVSFPREINLNAKTAGTYGASLIRFK